jgi:hypothetical protein
VLENVENAAEVHVPEGFYTDENSASGGTILLKFIFPHRPTMGAMSCGGISAHRTIGHRASRWPNGPTRVRQNRVEGHDEHDAGGEHKRHPQRFLDDEVFGEKCYE